MTRRTIASIAELKRMAQVANEEGVAVELERDGIIVRVMPFQPAQTIGPRQTREEETEGGLTQTLADTNRRR
ncbi:hypothetical protein ASF70_19045 [Rhizobium sp. Leaf321]|uniref:hypothetical protein n=1 Tax=Rhizobium sp. Leaf321 TaxID=1736335 RepID=UPI000715445D|nr:hypothetical protein [Rhizobium sp. Leaf321]KQQ70942.1 hypothetical protein ASF70_19045 [Rhizobium sp. Leaf321]